MYTQTILLAFHDSGRAQQASANSSDVTTNKTKTPWQATEQNGANNPSGSAPKANLVNQFLTFQEYQ